MIFHIAICSPDGALRSRLEHQCMEFFARREDACIVEQLQSPEALLQQDAAGLRYELYLIELAAVARPEGLTAAAELGPPRAAGFCGPHPGARIQRLPGGRHAVSAAAGAPAGSFCPAQAGGGAGIRPHPYRDHRRRCAGAGLCRDRISGMHPSYRALPPDHRGGCSLPLAAGALFRRGAAAACGRPLCAAAPLLCGQSGGGAAAGTRRGLGKN